MAYIAEPDGESKQKIKKSRTWLHVISNSKGFTLKEGWGRGVLEELLGGDVLLGAYMRSSVASFSGLSLRGGGKGFPLATMNMFPGYFHQEIEKK